MNRKKLIQAIERIATADGYTFYSTDEREMPRAIRKYPLIWLSPPLFTSMEGRKQGKITYSLTLHAMQANVKLPSAERERVWEQLAPVKSLLHDIMGVDGSSLEIVNRPPTRSKPLYMKVWEARKADGLEYDAEDEQQQMFLSEITKYNVTKIN